MNVLPSNLNTRDAQYQANVQRMRDLVADLKEKIKGNWRLWLLPIQATLFNLQNVARTTTVRLTRAPGYNTYPAWSSDGRSLYFNSERGAPAKRARQIRTTLGAMAEAVRARTAGNRPLDYSARRGGR